MGVLGGIMVKGDAGMIEGVRRIESRFAPCLWMTVVPWAVVLAIGLALMHVSAG